MITSYEQHGIEIGERQGRLAAMRETAIQIMQTRFGINPPAMSAYVDANNDQPELKRLIDKLITAESPEAVGLPLN